MSIRSRLASLACLLGLAGCGEPAPLPGYSSEAVGPHGGILVPLPGDKGFGEVVSKPLPKAKARARADAVLAVYFLAPDKSAALNPAPSDAALKMKMPGGDSVDVALKPQPDAKDPAGASLFASEPGLYAMDQMFGDLTVTVDGAPNTIPFEKHR